MVDHVGTVAPPDTTARGDGARARIGWPPVAWLPVGAAALTAAAVLAVFSNGYGFHRDELYFRMLPPDWGYADQPPLTPLLAKAAIALFGDSPWAVRVPAVGCVAAAIVLIALITRELGGGRSAQALAAWGAASMSGILIFGHILLTATVDLVLWLLVLLCAVRALLRDPRWWSAAGAGVGVALYNKHLIALLLIGLATGLAVAGPRPVLVSRWLWAGVALALLIGAPNLVYQATHGWPQLTMARAIADHKGADGRIMLVPLQILLVGPPLFPVVVAGAVALWRRLRWCPVRALLIAYLAVVVLVFASGGQGYYPFGLEIPLFAAGCVVTAGWIGRRAAVRRTVIVAAIALNALVTAVIALPVLPERVLGDTPVPGMNQTVGDQVGWPGYVATVAGVYRSLPEADRAGAIILTGNYGEAGAIDRYGPRYGLPAVYSGHNQLWWYGPPPSGTGVVIAVGMNPGRLGRFFGSCDPVAVLHNRTGVPNEEEGRPVSVCRGPRESWPVLWKRLRHFD